MLHISGSVIVYSVCHPTICIAYSDHTTVIQYKQYVHVYLCLLSRAVIIAPPHLSTWYYSSTRHDSTLVMPQCTERSLDFTLIPGTLSSQRECSPKATLIKLLPPFYSSEPGCVFSKRRMGCLSVQWGARLPAPGTGGAFRWRRQRRDGTEDSSSDHVSSTSQSGTQTFCTVACVIQAG